MTALEIKLDAERVLAAKRLDVERREAQAAAAHATAKLDECRHLCGPLSHALTCYLPLVHEVLSAKSEMPISLLLNASCLIVTSYEARLENSKDENEEHTR